MTVVGVLALAAQANAQGTWYTDFYDWQSHLTSDETAAFEYITDGNNPSPHDDSGATATAVGGFTGDRNNWLSTNNSQTPIAITFPGNAFFTTFGTSNNAGVRVVGSLILSIDGSLSNIRNTTTKSTGSTGYGYISDTAAQINVTVSGATADQYLYVDGFRFGNGTNPAGSSVAPEPGTLALALSGGCALVGMVIRRRTSN